MDAASGMRTCSGCHKRVSCYHSKDLVQQRILGRTLLSTIPTIKSSQQWAPHDRLASCATSTIVAEASNCKTRCELAGYHICFCWLPTGSGKLG